MRKIKLIQGSPEWHAHRRIHFNASETAAMLNLDPKTSRNDLLRMKATGHEKEFSDYTKNVIFPNGHKVEALSRPIIESIIGEELYPVTGVEDDGKKSASFDGLTMMEDIAFEHKQPNKTLFKSVQNGIVPDTHMPQIQQQLLVSGAKKVIFVVSDGTQEEIAYTEVLPDQEWFDRITAGWDQFEKDLADFEYKAIKEKPEASAIQELPALFVELSGEVKNTNLPMVKSAAQAFIESINTDLKTDQDFSDAEATVKFCDNAEKQLEATKSAALAQTQSIDEVMKTIDFIKDELRSKRLMLNKLVKQRKDEIKRDILAEASSKFSAHLNELNNSIAPCQLPAINPDFIGAMKNKRTLKSLHDAVDGELASAKTEANRVANSIKDNLEHFNYEAKGYEFLFNDLNQIINTPIEAFDALIKARIGEHKQAEERRLEQERERIRAEEAAKAQAAEAAQTKKTEPAQEQQEVKAEGKPATKQVSSGSQRINEVDQFYLDAKQQGKMPLSDADADTWIWPLILEAYNLGRKSTTRAA